MFSDGESDGGEDDTSDSDFEPEKEGGNVSHLNGANAFLNCKEEMTYKKVTFLVAFPDHIRLMMHLMDMFLCVVITYSF